MFLKSRAGPQARPRAAKRPPNRGAKRSGVLTLPRSGIIDLNLWLVLKPHLPVSNTGPILKLLTFIINLWLVLKPHLPVSNTGPLLIHKAKQMGRVEAHLFFLFSLFCLFV